MEELQNQSFCPECGAVQRNRLDCWHMLTEIIVWEYSDPELLKKHFLTISSYNLQHPAKFTNEAMQGLKTSLNNYLAGKESITEIRQRNTRMHDGPKRVLKPELERIIIPRQWPMTISDVYLPGHSLGAADRVQAWAESIRSLIHTGEI